MKIHQSLLMERELEQEVIICTQMGFSGKKVHYPFAYENPSIS
jgi:hypothetical protein